MKASSSYSFLFKKEKEKGNEHLVNPIFKTHTQRWTRPNIVRRDHAVLRFPCFRQFF